MANSVNAKQKITPFLWFDGKAEEAMNFYVSGFKNSKIISMNRAGKNGPVISGSFELDGQKFHALNGGPMFKFTEAISLFIDCEGQAEVDELWNKLTEGGQESRCGWLKDKYGLSWQVIPSVLGKFLNDPDPERSQRVMNAMLQMNKIIIKDLEEAYEGVAI
jgi:predicted 3-demethylubiquinone-9 3-methyltransferase (glyoxalase superfamily)